MNENDHSSSNQLTTTKILEQQGGDEEQECLSGNGIGSTIQQDGQDTSDTLLLENKTANSSQENGGERTISSSDFETNGAPSSHSKSSSPSTTTTTAAATTTTTSVHSSSSSSSPDHPPLILSVPIDSLHWVASFLQPVEWATFGECNKASNRVCKEIFHRVQMHGFRCATEVITAWKFGQHEDAKELCALYVEAGVPIYPHSLGHSYHTLVWRIGIESKEMHRLPTDLQNGSNNSSSSATTPATRTPIDRFYDERAEMRARERNNVTLTYLEEKSLHKLNSEGKETEATSSPSNALILRRQLSMNRNNLVGRLPHGQNEPLHAQLLLADGIPPGRNNRFALGRLSTTGLPPMQNRGLVRSNSQSDFTHRAPKAVVKVHRHLLDQHLLGRPTVDDNDGMMMTPTLSLSADFFHPHFSFLPVHSRDHPPTNDPFLSSQPRNPIFTSNNLMGLQGQNSFLEDSSDDLDSEGDEEPAIQDVDIFRENPLEPPNAPVPTTTTTTTDERPVESQILTPTFYDVLSNVDLEVYSATSTNSKAEKENSDSHKIKKHLRTRFSVYQQRLDAHLRKNDYAGVEECMLDFWDEFFPQTRNIHYYDRHTPVPRTSSFHKFMTNPCPKAIGIVQCEIERVKIPSKKKGVNVKGRLFPTYEYRLFIRHRPSDIVENSEAARRDTILMTAKNRGRRHIDYVSSASKKGANNYYLHVPQKDDVNHHYKAVNGVSNPHPVTKNGAGNFANSSEDNVLLGRLQSNFIGTEFQIFTNKAEKRNVPMELLKSNTNNEGSSDDEIRINDQMATASRRKNKFGRLSLRRSGTAGDIRDRTTPIQLHPNETFGIPSMRRSRSYGEFGRLTKTNRRAIANNSNDAFGTQRSRPLLYEEEEGAITYTANLLGSRPRIMDVCIPKVTSDGTSGAEWKKYVDMCNAIDLAGGSLNGGGYRMLNHLKQIQQRMENEDQSRGTNGLNPRLLPDGYAPPEDFGLLALQNRPPWWNVELGSFVLNFGGRVQVASVKNFQLCDRTDQDYIMLQFGRIQGRHAFTMDFQYPLTAVQAFAIAISSLQSKISFG